MTRILIRVLNSLFFLRCHTCHSEFDAKRVNRHNSHKKFNYRLSTQ